MAVAILAQTILAQVVSIFRCALHRPSRENLNSLQQAENQSRRAMDGPEGPLGPFGVQRNARRQLQRQERGALQQAAAEAVKRALFAGGVLAAAVAWAEAGRACTTGFAEVVVRATGHVAWFVASASAHALRHRAWARMEA